MSDILCVTNRLICSGDFLSRIEEIASCRPAGIILREKDMEPGEYKALAMEVLDICEKNSVLCILHSFAKQAYELSAKAIHMPVPRLLGMSEEEKSRFDIIGASCHSAAEAREAQHLGCGYITAGHVFATDCKTGLEPRGLGFLTEVCAAVEIPVYGIGGIDENNIAAVRSAGAAGACVMSGLMKTANVREFMKRMEKGDTNEIQKRTSDALCGDEPCTCCE